MRRGERLHSMPGIGLSMDVADRARGRGYRTMEREPVWMGSLRRQGVTFGLLLGLLVASCTGNVGPPTTSATPRLDAQRLGELQLTRSIPEQVSEACTEARQFAKVPVLCPELIPDIPITHMEGSYGAATFADEPRVYTLTFDTDFFHKPTNCGEASARGNCPGVKHWIVGAGDAHVVEKLILTDFVNEVKGDPNLVQTMHADGRTVLVYRFPEYPGGGINGSHVAALVRVDAQLVFASLHGTRWVEAAVEMALDLARQASAGT